MALFTDGTINTSGDLQRYENNILNVASVEGIDLSAKMLLAQEEIATELLLFIHRSSIRDPRFLVRRHIGVADIVVTPPLMRWHGYKTLALVYRDAYNNQLNDRYKGKWAEYEQLAKTAAETLFAAGAGIVHRPLPKATGPLLTSVPAGVSGASYYLRISWLGTSGQEGAVSDPYQVLSTDGSEVVIGTAAPSPEVTYWNIYAGGSPDDTRLQNLLPLAITATWVLPSTGLSDGKRPGNGQSPEWWLVDRRVMSRG